MHARVSTLASAVFILLAVVVSACENNSGPIGTRLQSPSPFQSRLVSVEPAALIPELVGGPHCGTRPPFRTRFNLSIHAERNLFLRRMGFELRDRTGRRVRPAAIADLRTSGGAFTSTPVPMPSSSPVPIPGTLAFHGAVVSPPFATIGLALHFDCGVRADGALVIDVETDDDGVIGVTQISVPVSAPGA